MDTLIYSKDLIQTLKNLVPEQDALEGDSVGLIYGRPDRLVRNVLFSLQLTPSVVEEAIQKNAEMIIVHHPISDIFKSSIRTDQPTGKMIADILRNDICVYVAQSNLCVAPVIGTDALAALLGLKESQILKVTAAEKCYKLVTCIPALPEDYTGQIRTRIGDHGLSKGPCGAGVVGNYSHVSSFMRGVQNFVPLEDTHPFIGEPGVLESVEVERFEMIVNENMLDEVIHTMCEIHPYEKVEYDVYPLQETRNHKGLGRIGLLNGAVSLESLASSVKEQLNVSTVRIFGAKHHSIQKAAISIGCVPDIIQIACESGADVLIKGDISRSDAHLAKELGIALIDPGSYALERPMLSQLAVALSSSIEQVSMVLSSRDFEMFEVI